MKLRNKKTGEIKDWNFGNWYQTILNPENKEKYKCNLNDFIDRTVKFRKEWEDYEEPKEWYWFIEDNGIIQRSCHYEDLHPTLDKARKEIGNYFSSREEAEKAVEKLKAWKRLKDKGFRFRFWQSDGTVFFEMPRDEQEWSPNTRDDLDLLFGGEE